MLIAQDQHPERCLLFARWKGIDAPILWDPFNLTGSRVVPHFHLVDRRGVVRVRDAKLEDLEPFLAREAREAREADAVAPAVATKEAPPRRAALDAVLLEGADPSALVKALAEDPARADDPALAFRLGVAHRLRYDSPHAREGDFQAAVDAWRRALAARPDQYVWRRRLQQYGPLVDKPYPFFAWVEEARRALLARGETPPALDTPLTLSERSLDVAAQNPRALDAPPEGLFGLPSDDDALRVETAWVEDTTGKSDRARLHVVVRPRDARRVAWHGGAEPVVLWFEPPEGWTVRPRGLAHALPEEARDGPVAFELEVVAPARTAGEGLRLIVVAPICRVNDGTCLGVRREKVVHGPP